MILYVVLDNAEITAITEDSSHSKEKIKQEKKDEPQFFVRLLIVCMH